MEGFLSSYRFLLFFLISVVFEIKTVIAYQSEAADFPFFP